MFKETVDVIDSSGNKVEIKFNKRKMCSCCRMYNICGRGEGTLIIHNPGLSLKEGDKIQIAIDEKKTLLANIIIFLIPTIIFMACLVATQRKGEAVSFFLALGAVFIYYGVAKMLLKKHGERFKVKILQKL